MKIMKIAAGAIFAVGTSACLATAASAQVKVGVTLSVTGPGASLGIVERNVFDLLPRELHGQKIEYIVLDDGSDPNIAVRNARKLIEEDKVDILMGGTTSPNCLALVPVVANAKIPFIAMGSNAAIVEPMDDQRRWVFKTVHNDAMMMDAVVADMVKNRVKTIGYIGLADATGEGYLKAMKPLAEKNGMAVGPIETYNRTDQSVLAQAVRLASTKPDAIFIASLGTPAATPQIELVKRGYKGRIYHTHGVANADFLRVAGSAAEGMFLPIGPLLIAAQLPDNNPSKAISTDVVRRYEEKFGKGSSNTFIANAYDAYLLFANALPTALQKAKPGSPEFRLALRDALEATKEMPGTQGVYTMSAENHVGLDERSRSIITVRDGQWRLAN